MLHAAVMLAALSLTSLDDAKWQPLTPGGSDPEVSTVVTSDTLSQTLLRLGKGATLPGGKHVTDATLVLLDGELSVEAGGKVHKLVQGSVLQLPAGTDYKGKTAWDRKALVLVTLAGPWSRAAE